MSLQGKRGVIFVMGVSGSGKSSIGRLLAEQINYTFVEGDNYHAPENVDKMSRGIPLTDSDRMGWLSQLNQIAKKNADVGCVIACSALKSSYRIQLAKDIDKQVLWIYLNGDYDLIFNRMKKRKNHFMEAHMLKSQFDDLEEPQNAIMIDVNQSLDTIIEQLISHIS